MYKLALAFLFALPTLAACADDTEDPSNDGSSAAKGSTDGKAVPPTDGSGDGKACAPIPPCKAGEVPVDTGNDGCYDTCKASTPKCEVVPVCGPNETAVDTNGDGCADACSGQKACAPIPPCKEGEVPIDTGNDGCYDLCAPKK